MSFQAMTWAITQVAGSPSAKATLWSLANYANSNFVTFVSQDRVAEESEQSLDSVQRRYEDLAGRGLLRRIKLKRHGRRTSDLIILAPSSLFAAQLLEIEPHVPRGCEIMSAEVPKGLGEDLGSDDAATGAPEGRGEGADVAANCGSVDGPHVAANCGSVEPHVAANCGYVDASNAAPDATEPPLHAAANCGYVENAGAEGVDVAATCGSRSRTGAAASVTKDLTKIPPTKSSPTSGEAQGLPKEPSGQDRAKQAEGERRLAQFRKDYPEPSNHPAEVATAFLSLDEARQALVVRAAKGAAEVRRRTPKKTLVDQRRFVCDEALWAEYARFAPPEAPPVRQLDRGSVEWRAMVVMRSIAGLPVDGALACRGEVPEGAAGIAAFADEDGTIDAARWVAVERGAAQCVAWSKLVSKWLGRWPEPDRVYLDCDGRPCPRDRAAQVTHGVGTRFEWTGPRFTIGLAVPCEWPPGKGAAPSPALAGKGRGEGAFVSGTLMTDDDMAEFGGGGR